MVVLGDILPDGLGGSLPGSGIKILSSTKIRISWISCRLFAGAAGVAAIAIGLQRLASLRVGGLAP